MQYYDEVQYIAGVDENDTIQKKVERWEAHKKAILHRALTLAIFVGDTILLQHRKHPVFDSVYDMTISTHQTYRKDTLQDDEETIHNSLERELYLNPHSLREKPKYQGNLIYQSKDPKSIFIEHELCHVYTCDIDTVPGFNPEFAYGLEIVRLDEIKKTDHRLYPLLAPWVKVMIQKEMV